MEADIPNLYSEYWWFCPTCSAVFFGVCPPEDCGDCATPQEDFLNCFDMSVEAGYE